MTVYTDYRLAFTKHAYLSNLLSLKIIDKGQQNYLPGSHDREISNIYVKRKQPTEPWKSMQPFMTMLP